MAIYPGNQSFKVKSGGTWRTVFQWKADGVPVDMTNWSAKMQIRKAVGSPIIVTPTFIMVDATVGKFSFVMSSAVTDAIVKGTYKYDMFLYRTDQGTDLNTVEVIPMLEGTFTFTENITEPPAYV